MATVLKVVSLGPVTNGLWICPWTGILSIFQGLYYRANDDDACHKTYKEKRTGPLGFSVIPVPVITSVALCTHLPRAPLPWTWWQQLWVFSDSAGSPQGRAGQRLCNAPLQRRGGPAKGISGLSQCVSPPRISSHLAGSPGTWPRWNWAHAHGVCPCGIEPVHTVPLHTRDFGSQKAELWCLLVLDHNTMSVLSTKSKQKSTLR